MRSISIELREYGPTAERPGTFWGLMIDGVTRDEYATDVDEAVDALLAEVGFLVQHQPGWEAESQEGTNVGLPPKPPAEVITSANPHEDPCEICGLSGGYHLNIGFPH